MMSHVEQRDGGYWVAGTRVSLDSVVYAFHEGQSPEMIRQSFPALRLEQVDGAIAYYLGHRAEIDAYVVQARQAYEAARRAERAADPRFYKRLAASRRNEVASQQRGPGRL